MKQLHPPQYWLDPAGDLHPQSPNPWFCNPLPYKATIWNVTWIFVSRI